MIMIIYKLAPGEQGGKQYGARDSSPIIPKALLYHSPRKSA